jgi:apolipoprotein N-acyltransferase
VKLKALFNAIVLSWGWRRCAIAFVAGAASALAMAPINAWPVLFLTFPTLVWLIDSSGDSRWGSIAGSAWCGWWFGFGYFVAGLYWIGYPFLVDAPTFGWMMPFAVLGLPAVLAFYTAAGAALARLLWTRGSLRILSFGAALTIVEYLRGHLFTGFPWNAFGYAIASPLVLAQIASLVGLWGMTFIVFVVFATPATLADDASETRRPALPFLIAVAVLIALAGYGASRLHRNQTRLVDKVHLRIMQPNLQQDVRFNYAARRDVMNRYVTLSSRSPSADSPGMQDVTHLIWPESAFPFFLAHEPDALAQITQLLPPGAVLITGGVRVAEPYNPAAPQAFNSIYAIDHSGSILGIYDKVHLVPFGEYLPFKPLLESLGMQVVTKQIGGFQAGDRRRLITMPGTPPMLPLICYEIIFPNAVMPPDGRPGWIVNVTNDGWFGISSGPYQHFQQARVRAIEEGLPLVRAANTGISAVVDPVGRIINALPLGEEGVLDSGLPRSIREPIYARLGDIPAALIVVMALIIVVRHRLRSELLKV